MFSYTVTCEFTDEAVVREWVEWLRLEHLRDVLDGGALEAEVVMIDRETASGSAVTCEVRYRFADRAAFEIYERDHAPRLRAEGLKKFPLERGLRYSRRTGEVVASMR